VLLGSSWFLLRRAWATAPLLLAIPAAWAGAALLGAPPPAAAGVVSVERAESYYGTLRVIDRVSAEAHVRELRIDGQLQGAVDLRYRLPVSLIMYFLEFLPVSVRPDGQDCLVVGLGAGVVPRWYAARGVRTEVVEINPEVVRMARTHFGLPETIPVTVADAREFLGRPGRRYDYLVLDVFNGDTTPEHLLSLEAFRLAKTRLSPRGVLALNVAGSTRHETMMTASLLRTLREVFATVECYPLFEAGEEPGWGNLAVVAYDFAPAGRAAGIPRGEAVHPDVWPLVARYLAAPYAFPPGTPALVLTDDHNPFDVRDLWLKEQARREILRSVEPALLF
jgi:spermidine synthase